MAPQEETHRTPVICVDPATLAGAEIFDPNAWSRGSQTIMHSCLAEYSVLHHCVKQICSMCENRERVCENQIRAFRQQWAQAKFNLEKVMLFGEQPDLHMRIEAFFSGVKSLLDLLAQILSTEKVVTARIDAFHRARDVYGGVVLNALKNNAPKERQTIAGEIATLINEHKAAWIDQTIHARDQLIHPTRGMHQLMFHFECTEENGQLECKRINPPVVDSVPIDNYTRRILDQARAFSKSYLGLLQKGGGV